ncbi:hypothetical protein VP01_62g20 [Puccinia sorghi]|uniref:Retrovirus-related Pol polyprotein from transposon TNT 1-94-like beta-barrel domain-containing protein n=1 Tax=Puccinia sorghi TaxID=27349 RepID=A0A0L6UIF2_9BASI|nr:hypothetical protein VP01_62g20 [Puccinia sorghi]
MDKLNTVLYKTAIESIPLLTQENYSMWRSRVVNLLDLLKIKDAVLNGKRALSSSEELILRTVLAAKLDANIHSNVVDHSNKENGIEIWKKISEYFASTQSANRARVWNNFSLLNYDDNDVNGFITKVRAAIEKMHEVGINIDIDVIGYEIIKKFPKTPELNSISSAITHSGKEMTPDLVLDHLRLHANKQSIETGSSGTTQQVSLFTDHSSTKCKPNAHNTRAPHPAHRCWMVYPHLRPASGSNYNREKNNQAEHSVSSFHSYLSYPSKNFVLDSGSSAHMTSNVNLFFALKLQEKGIVRTSSGNESLKIKGSGSIKLSNSRGDFILNNVLYVPELCVNLLSVRCLVADGFNVFFDKNSFSINKNNTICMDGHYVNNLPTIEFNNLTHECMFSSGEMLHKALGHVSYRRLRQKLCIPVKDSPACEACAVSKITRGSFHTRHSKASKPFEELHLDIVGPISPSSREGHRVLNNQGKIINSKHLKFLDFESTPGEEEDFVIGDDFNDSEPTQSTTAISDPMDEDVDLESVVFLSYWGSGIFPKGHAIRKSC